MVIKICPICKNKFECNSSKGNCWCQKYKLSKKILNSLKEKYKDCICENCLKKLL